MTTRPAFPRVASSPEGQRTLAGVGDIVRQMFAPGSFLQRLIPGRLLRPVVTGTPLALAWGEMNRLPPGNIVARLPQIRPEWVGVPLTILKGATGGFAEIQPAGVRLDGSGRQPTVDGKPYGFWLREPGMRQLITDGANWFTSRDTHNGFQVFNILDYGAGPDMPADVNRRGIQAAIDAAEVSGGVVLFPGDSSTVYLFDAQLTVTASNVMLWAPGRARIKPSIAFNVLIAVGDIDTGANLSQSNTLASNSAAGSRTVVLAAGKGANFTAGEWAVVRSTAVIPEHDSAVVNKMAEFVNIYSIATDTLTISRSLRYSYLTADTAQVYKVAWIENFAVVGLGIDGNSQIQCAIGIQLSWCLNALFQDVEAVNLQQRFLRFQACRGVIARGVRQQNGLSNGFQGDSGHFSYTIIESGLNEGLVSTGLQVDRCRHGYSTGAGWTTNAGITSTTINEIGVPMNSLIADGVHSNARGAGWDTHEVGVDITFRNCQTLGGLYLGFTTRSVRTRYVNCYARDTIAAAIQIGNDAQDTIIESLDWHNTNLGVDDDTGSDWTLWSPIRDNSARTYLGKPAPNLVDNSSFEVWDRGTSGFTTSGATANRWQLTVGSGATVEVRRRGVDVTTSLSNADRFYVRVDRTVTGSASSFLSQWLAGDVRMLAGQRIALSFDTRSDSDNLVVFLRQYFGTGGSPSANVDTTPSTRLLDSAWQRQTVIIDIPSIAGKTIGSNEDSALILFFEWGTGNGVSFFDLDRVKIEIGRTPTTYVPEPAALERERCARWYEKSFSDGQNPGSSASSAGSVYRQSSVNDVNSYRLTVPFSTRKGLVPNITFFAPGFGASGYIRNLSITGIVQAATENIGNSAFTGGPASITGIATGSVLQFQWAASVPNYE